ncbi:12155_t:CDS:1, partial [Cetraspora pellucida]
MGRYRTKPNRNSKRSSVACERCRKDKVRCVIDDDKCKNCTKVGAICIIPDKSKR